MRRYVANGVVLIGFVACVWAANRRVCALCEVSENILRLDHQVWIQTRLYLPESSREPIPTVVVLHGYVANMAFMEIPWAADLTQLGCAALFIDRRGHGRSGGTLRPSRSDSVADVAAAVAVLRADPRVDPRRIAILGHSDGATAALTAGSRDWDVNATIAVSASVAPAYLVNHVVPRNLLLIYGNDDRFVLDHTDQSLVWNATRGVLDGAGRIGNFADGSARELVRIPGAGHIDVLSNETSRSAVLDWLRSAFGLQRNVTLSSRRRVPVAVGVTLLLVLLAIGGGTLAEQPAAEDSSVSHWRLLVGLTIVWILGLLASPWLERRLTTLLPSQLGGVFGAVLLGPAVALVLTGGFLTVLRRFELPRLANGLAPVTEVLRGALTAAATAAALALLALHYYEARLTLIRLVLLGLCTLLAVAPFGLMEIWLAQAGARRGEVVVRLMLALATAALSVLLFARMAVVPGLLLSAVLVFSAAYRYGYRRRSPLATLVFETLLLGWLGAVALPLY